MKAYVAMIAHNLKTLCTEPAPKFSRNSKKIGQLQGGRPKCLFGKNCRYIVPFLELDCKLYTFL